MSKLTKGFFQDHGREGGKKSRAQLTAGERQEAAKQAARARWNLHQITRACVLGAAGDPQVVKLGIERTLRNDPKMILRHWPELVASGSLAHHRQAHEVEWAKRLVKGLLEEIGVPAEQSRYLPQVGKGLLDLVAAEINRYHREQRAQKGAK